MLPRSGAGIPSEPATGSALQARHRTSTLRWAASPTPLHACWNRVCPCTVILQPLCGESTMTLSDCSSLAIAQTASAGTATC